MTTNWSLDHRFIEDVISKGYILLEDPKLTKLKKKNIRADIKKFENFLIGDYEDKSLSIQRPPCDIEKLKRYVLRRMQKQFNDLGEETIHWAMDLYFEKIFKLRGSNKKTYLNLDEQAELTIENYSENSKLFLTTAKPILSDEIIRQVQYAPNLKNSSYCYFDEITDLPYIIVNPKENPWVLNHETQHAIEEIRKIIPNRFYSELSPIFFELLFNDILYKNQGFLQKGDCSDRITDAQESINKLFHYFDIMLNFKATNFQVPTDIFIEEFSEICGAETEEGVINFIRKEIVPADLVDEMSYLFSYLKAIELREKAQKSKQDCAYLLDPYIKSKKFVFTPKEDSFSMYRRFTEEMKEKTK